MPSYRDTRRRSTDPVLIDFDLIRSQEARIVEAKKARNTLVTYASSWRCFRAWCAAAGVEALPASTAVVRDYVTWCVIEQYRLWTIRTRVNAIQHYHRLAGHASPCDASLREYLGFARRHLKEKPLGKAALTYDLLCRIAGFPGNGPVAVRNRAMLLLGFAAGWRRGEIVALQFSDVRFVEQGLELFQRYSKTDQSANGRLVGIHAGTRPATCPVAALRAWIEIRGTWAGHLFTRFDCNRRFTREGLEPRGEIVYRFLKKALARLGEDPQPFGAHSLRSGMITTAVQHGADLAAIMHRTGHRRAETVLTYVRPATCFDLNPLANVL